MTQKAVTALKTLMITSGNNYAMHAPFRKGDELEHWKRLLLHIGANKSERNNLTLKSYQIDRIINQILLKPP